MSFFPQEIPTDESPLFSVCPIPQHHNAQQFTGVQWAQLQNDPGHYTAPSACSVPESQSSGTDDTVSPPALHQLLYPPTSVASPSSSNATMEQPLNSICEQYLEMGDINKESCPCGWKRPRGRPTHDEAQKAAKTAEARRHGYVWPRPVPQEKLQQRELAKVVTKEKREKRKREKEEGMAAGKRQRQVEDQPPLSFQAALASEPQQFQQPGETGQVPAWLSIEEKVRQELTAFLAWSPVEEDNAEQLQRSEEDEQIRSQDDEEQFRWPEESEVDEIPASEAATPYQAQEPGEVQSVPELDNIWFGLNYLDALKHHHSRESNPLLDPDIALFYKTYEEGMSGMVEYLNEQDPEPAPEAVSDAESFMGHPSLFGDLDGLEL